ncbi:MAG: tetratricopeptide repeat protein [Planctomycetota bacterium]|nr:tetratricopeptide repeat protein [Planctomycetota bacterium]
MSDIVCPKCHARYRAPSTPTSLRCKNCGTVFDASPAADLESDAAHTPTVVPNKAPTENHTGGDTTLTPGQVETLWAASVSPDMDPGATIKGPASQKPSPPRLSVRPQTLAPKGSATPGAHYELLDVLGEGGMGLVYAARQTSVDRLIALKVIKASVASDEAYRAKFLAEAAVTGDLDHPNIVPLYDLGSSETGAPFYAMKLVKGTPWSKTIKQNALRENLGILQRVADAVAFAHSRGVIHRDLKPDNVMLGEYGEVLLMDWGLALSVSPQGKAEPLGEHAACGGTPAYMAPEMAQGNVASIGPRSDVYLLGAILFEIVTGKRPHCGPGAMACLRAAAANEIVAVEEKNELRDIALKAMATRPEERYAGVKDFQQALKDYAGHIESVILSEQAEKALEKAASSRDYNDFAKAMLAFEQALELWSGNKAAAQGAHAARLAYATCARQKGDLELALTLLDAGGLKDAPLWREVQAAKAERDARTRRLRTLKFALAAAAAAIVVGLAVAFLWIRAEQAATALERDKAVAAQKAEAEQRRLAEESQRKALAAAAAERKAKETAEAKEAETAAVLDFVQSKVFAAARPEGQEGGLGREVTLRKAIQSALPFVETSFSKQPLIEARLRVTLGISFTYLGEAKTAAKQYEAARAIYTKHLGPDHPDTLTSMSGLASSYRDLGRHAEALKLDEETLALRKTKLGPDHPNTLTSRIGLAASYDALGRHAEALKLQEETLALQKAKLGPDHPDTLLGMAGLAVCYSALHRHAEALKLQEETLALQKAKLGPDHPDTLISMSNLAGTYYTFGRHAEALKLQEETLTLRKAKLGPDHPDTLISMSNLALSYSDLGRQAEALKLWEETLALMKAKLGPDHPFTLGTMSHLAIHYSDVGRPAQALKLSQEAVELHKAKLGPDHPDTLRSMTALARSLNLLGRFTEAVPILDEVVRRAGGRADSQGPLQAALSNRFWNFKQRKESAGCRATAEMWEGLKRTDAASLYDAACMRAVTAAVIRDTETSPEGAKQADAEAEKAMAWLKQAVGAGYNNAAHMAKDADLDALRQREDFEKLAAELEARKGQDGKP